jgi:hypothetical protein
MRKEINKFYGNDEQIAEQKLIVQINSDNQNEEHIKILHSVSN